MGRNAPEKALNSLVSYLEGAGQPQTVSEIVAQSPGYPRRSIQRWLTSLVTQGRIERTGRGPAARYAAMLRVSSRVQETPLLEVPLRVTSQELVQFLRKPRSERPRSDYDRGFLASYIPNQTWYLGEGVRRHLRKVGDTGESDRPAGTFGRQVLSRLLIDFSWASSRLEGNTYSLLDTRRLIEEGERAAGKNSSEAQMILNHKAAIELLVEDIDAAGFDMFTFLNLHGVLSDNLLPDPDWSGRLRQRAVEIGGSNYRPSAVPQLIEEAFREFLEKAAAISDPYEQAFFTLVHVPYLQPFEDVNKRVSRVGANLPLLKRNLCPLTFVGVPEASYVDAILTLYETKRTDVLEDVFVWACERSASEYVAARKVLAEPDPVRLRYRAEIYELVRDIVREVPVDPPGWIDAAVASRVPSMDRERVRAQVLDDLKRLHEGVLARYRLRPSEFRRWQSRLR